GGQGGFGGEHRAGRVVRLSRGGVGVEVKPPVPQIPPPVWTEFKDLQEFEKYRQHRADDDKTSNALASIADAIHHMPGGWIVTTGTDKIFNWARKSSIWPVTFGLACCAIEMMATFASRFDVERFGMVPWASPRHSDLMIVSGTVTIKIAPLPKRIYDQLPDPKCVVPLALEQWQPAPRFARATLGCAYFSFLTAVDWKEQGFEVLCRVENLDARVAVFMRTRLAPGADRCPSLTGVWRGADWMERECWDMFGVRFEGHPDQRRILLGEDWEGHPLRKDYAVDTPHAP